MRFLIYCDTNLWSDFKEISVCSRQKIFTFTYILISKLLKDIVYWVPMSTFTSGDLRKSERSKFK